MINETEFLLSEEASKTYDYHLLSGHFLELETPPHDLIEKTISDAEEIYKSVTSKKGADKISIQINTIVKYSSALALHDKCVITDIEGLFSFICVRHPELELDWKTLQSIISASGKEISDYSEGKKTELALTVYISAIKNALKNKSEHMEKT